MNGKKKLLYIMGIDWNWIFQRPQIIAAHLQERYEVTVVFPRSLLHLFHKNRTSMPKHYCILWTFPLQEKIKPIGIMSTRLSHKIFRDIYDYDAVIVGYPLYYRYIPANYHGVLIYDCMDNHEALYPYKKGLPLLQEQEKKLAANCTLLLTSSQRLLERWQKDLADATIKTKLLRNGTDMAALSPSVKGQLKTMYRIGYFGTISEWFNFGLLLESLKKFRTIEYHLIGPICQNQCPTHPRIVFEGTLEHQGLLDVVQDFDCLCMPFIVDDVVEWVDPVKLYEYIAFGKCIISVYYKEIERFRDYVYFYNTVEEYICLLDELSNMGFPPKYNAFQQTDFLKKNSWSRRFEDLDSLLDQLLKEQTERKRNENKGNERVWHKAGGHQDVSASERT